MQTIAYAPMPAPDPTKPGNPAPPATPDLEALRAQLTDISTKLTAADKTIESMVGARSPVGGGWAPYLATLSASLLSARDTLLVAKPDVAPDLGAKLGVDVRRLSEASGCMVVFAKQRATLAEGWSSYLDATITNVTAAAALLAPPAPEPPKGPQPPVPPKGGGSTHLPGPIRTP